MELAGGDALAGDAVVGQRVVFASRVSIVGIVAAWMTFGINEVYAVLSGIVFLREGTAVENGPYLSVMALLVVLMGPFLVLSMAAVHAFADPSRRIYGLAALGFMVACVTVTSCVNFLLLLVSASPDLFTESRRSSSWSARPFSRRSPCASLAKREDLSAVLEQIHSVRQVPNSQDRPGSREA